MKKNVFSNVFLLIGCLVGAGFISGRELILYFANGYYFLYSVVLCFFLFFILVFFSLKKINDNNLTMLELGKVAFPKFSGIFNVLLYSCYYILVLAMLSGIFSMFDLNIFIKIFFCLFCMFLLKFDYRGLKIINIVLIPLVLVFVAMFCTLSFRNIDFGKIEFVGSNNFFLATAKIVLYTTCNCFTSIALLAVMGKNSTHKSIFWSSLLFSLILCICIFLLCICIFPNYYECNSYALPILFLSGKIDAVFSFFFCVIVFFAIFTTLLSSLYPFTNIIYTKLSGYKSYFASSAFCLLSIILSNFGFTIIVNYFYPIMGIFGLIFFICFFAGKTKLKREKNYGRL